MTLWRLASSSLLVASAKSFVLPPVPTASQQAPSRATGRQSSCCHDVCGPAAVAVGVASAARPGTAGRGGRGTTTAPRRTTLRQLDAAGEGIDEDAIDGWDGNLDALDAQLRREAGTAPQAASAAGDFDDGFGALDDLLGLDDSALSQSPGAAAAGSGAVDIDPFAKLDAPVVTDSLDDLLSELQPRGAQPSSPSSAATARRRPAARTTPTPPPPSASAAAGPDVSGSWLDDLLDGGNEDLKVPASPAPASGILESLIDDETVVGDGPRAATAAASSADTTTTSPGLTAGEDGSDFASAPADAPPALDDWLNELLQDGEDQGASSNSGREASTTMPVSPFEPSRAGGSATPTPTEASLDDDPWAFAAEDGGMGGGGGGGEGNVGENYGDVITGSNQLEGWKTNTGSTAAPKRSNVMGRARRAVAGSDGREDGAMGDYAQEKSQPWDPEGADDEEGGRTNEWGAGDAWGRKGESSGPSWWDKDGPGMGMEEATGRRFGAPGEEKKRALDPIEEAQRACAADLKKLGQRGQWEDATRALVGARVRGVPVNVYMYNSAISAVSKAGRWKEALSMMEQMEKDGIAFDEFTYSAAIVACGRGGKPRKALELLDEMVRVHGIAPDIICYGAAIQACGDAGLSEEALSLMRRMSGDGLLPDKTAYNSAIIACGEKGQWEKALELLGEMRTGGLRPDQNSYRFAMKACGVGGRWERAVLLLHEMEEDGSTPDTAAFQAALDVLKDAAQWEKAMDIISEMDELGVPPTESCFSSAIAACSEVGAWLPASKARKLMGYYGLQPELETYKSIIKACLVGKEFNMALTTLFDLQKSGKRADQETWDMLIELCAVVGKWDAALEIIRDIFAEEVWFDMTAIRARFFDCPSEDIRMKALTIIAMEARTAPSMKRKKMNNIRAAKKRKPGYRAPEKAPTRRKKAKSRSGGEKPGSDGMPQEFADLSLE